MAGSASPALGVSDTLFFPASPTQEGERKGVAVGWIAELMACFSVSQGGVSSPQLRITSVRMGGR